MGISKLFYRHPVYKFSRFDLPINFDYPADLFLITKVISTFKMQFILSEMLLMGLLRDSGQPPALAILELLAGSPPAPAAPGKSLGVRRDVQMHAQTLLSRPTPQAGGC